MATFEKGHTKKGGRQKGTRNKASANVKELLAKVYCEEDFIADFAKLRKSRDDRVRLEVLKLALAYQYGKPKPVPGELLILGDFRHFAIMAVVRLAGPAAFIPSWLVAESVLGEYPRYPATPSFEVTSSLGPGGIRQPPVCDTCLGSEIAIGKTESSRPAVGRPLVAPPVRRAMRTTPRLAFRVLTLTAGRQRITRI
jgi:hypothetical protein